MAKKKKKASARKRVSPALSGFLKKLNPAFKSANATRVKMHKNGSVMFSPVRRNPWGLSEYGRIFAAYSTKREAQSAKRYTFGGRGKVVRVSA